ncbi:sugar ABC transporter permease [Clostridium sp. BNL1100]|uniref:carbohydrate ABC transporter permease n=1 Tax=Clostridium sp. BNL1100 TaxID=755731 RepID=UPI00024A7B20|nr:sugar ABC transporter permease [Clostridium sp. BNL1100]AEY64440.1 permease component of ABC-type sugar transporter [Clostridium sp. BNL1100]
MDKVFSDKKAILIFMFPAFLFFIAIIAAPVIMSAYYSTLDWDGIGKAVFIGFDNFKKLFINNVDGFPLTVRNSFVFLLVSVFIQLPVSLIFALILAKGIKGEGFFRGAYFVPVIISTVVIGQLWMKIYNPDYGLLNVVLRNIGLDNLAQNWLGDSKTALGATFVPILWQYVGYHMLLMYAAIKSISPDIFEAALIDGSSGISTAFRITIPLITPMLKVSVTFSVIGSLKIFDLIYVLTNGGPAGATEVPSTLMVKTIFMSYKYGYGSAMAVFIILECFLFTALINRLFKKVSID